MQLLFKVFRERLTLNERIEKKEKDIKRNTRKQIWLLSSQKEICLRCAYVVFSIYLCNIDFMLCATRLCQSESYARVNTRSNKVPTYC